MKPYCAKATLSKRAQQAFFETNPNAQMVTDKILKARKFHLPQIEINGFVFTREKPQPQNPISKKKFKFFQNKHK